jgi:hypothetical protein
LFLAQFGICGVLFGRNRKTEWRGRAGECLTLLEKHHWNTWQMKLRGTSAAYSNNYLSASGNSPINNVIAQLILALGHFTGFRGTYRDLTGDHTSAVSGGSGFGRNPPFSAENLASPLVAAKTCSSSSPTPEVGTMTATLEFSFSDWADSILCGDAAGIDAGSPKAGPLNYGDAFPGSSHPHRQKRSRLPSSDHDRVIRVIHELTTPAF